MFKVDGVTYQFHHMGIPTSLQRPGERYSQVYRMYTSDDPCRMLRVQWHRFEPECPLHPLLQTAPHPAFKVSDLNKAIAGKVVILGPYEPIAGFKVAAIEDGGIAIEFVETNLSDDELWPRAKQTSILYSKDETAQRKAMAATTRR
jgi:hypothetical protein